MIDLNRPAGTGKRKRIVSRIAAEYWMLDNGEASTLNLETLIRRYMDDNRTVLRNLNKDLVNTVGWAQLPKILLVAPKNNKLDVLEELFQQALPVFDEKTNRWVMDVPIYLLLGSKYDTRLRASLRSIRDNMLPQSCQKLFPDVTTLCILSSVYRAFPFPHTNRCYTLWFRTNTLRWMRPIPDFK